MPLKKRLTKVKSAETGTNPRSTKGKRMNRNVRLKKKAGEAESSSTLKAEPEKCRLINSRCFVRHFAEFIHNLCITPKQLAAVEKLTFGRLLGLKDIAVDKPLIDWLLNTYNVEEHTFMVGSKSLSFTAEEFCLILGLPGTGHRVEYRHYAKSNFRDVFFDGLRCARGEIEKHLQTLVKPQDSDSIANFVRMLLTYMFACFLFPTTSYTCPLPLLHYLEDLDKIDTFAWGRAAHSFLMDNVHESALRVEKRRTGEINDVGYLGGCSIALQVWFYERTSMEPTAFGLEPRILKWQGGKVSHHRSTGQKLIASLQDEKVVEELSAASDFEKKLLENFVDGGKVPANLQAKTAEVSCSGVGRGKKKRRLEMQSEVKLLRELVSSLQAENVYLKEENSRLVHEVAQLKKVSGQHSDDTKVENIEVHVQEEKVEESWEHEVDVSEAVVEVSEAAAKVRGKRKKRPTASLQSPYTNPITGKQTMLRIQPYAGRCLLTQEDRELVDLFVRNKAEGGRSWSTQCNRSCIAQEQIHDVLYNKQIQDDVIDVFQILLSEGVENQTSKAPCIFFSPFLTRKIREGNIPANDAYMRHISNDTIKMARLLMMPLHTADHWHLLVINMESRKYESYSSIQSKQYHDHAHTCVSWAKRCFAAFDHAVEMSMDQWPFEIKVDCPQQANIVDCGIFLLKYENCLTNGEALNFGQDDIALFRAEIVLRMLKELRIIEDLTK